jgi:HEPN domain-containing protein
MIPNQTLKYLISNKIRDAKVLIDNKRFPAAVYIAGYAIEIALKYKICQSLRFNLGFPETKNELNSYLTVINGNNLQPLHIQLGDIRNHDLGKLLLYSGTELKIKTSFNLEWATISRWNPEIRYRKYRALRNYAKAYLKAAKKIIKEIA